MCHVIDGWIRNSCSCAASKTGYNADKNDLTELEMELGRILRHARTERGFSQLELALRLNVSQRHVSFVESGRTGASRELIRNWMSEADAAAPLTNAALLAAGYAAHELTAGSSVAPWDKTVRAALDTMLLAHEPYPAIVFDADWNMRAFNRSGQWLCSVVMEEYWAAIGEDECCDMITCAADPRGLLGRMVDPHIAGAALLAQLRSECWTRPGLTPRVDHLEMSLIARFGPSAMRAERNPAEPYLKLSFETALGRLSFVTIQSVFGLPHNVTSASPRMELWFPIDDKTRAVMVSREALMAADRCSEQ
jgi:transcriptional regulator with XRE-family HTH domain